MVSGLNEFLLPPAELVSTQLPVKLETSTNQIQVMHSMQDAAYLRFDTKEAQLQA